MYYIFLQNFLYGPRIYLSFSKGHLYIVILPFGLSTPTHFLTKETSSSTFCSIPPIIELSIIKNINLQISLPTPLLGRSIFSIRFGNNLGCR
jgi:hypothetical protein